MTDATACENCAFVVISPHANMATKEAARKFATLHCHRFPKALRVYDGHWCGEFKTASPPPHSRKEEQ